MTEIRLPVSGAGYLAGIGVLTLCPESRLWAQVERCPFHLVSDADPDRVVTAALTCTPNAIDTDSPWYLIRSAVHGRAAKGQDLYQLRLDEMRGLLSQDLLRSALTDPRWWPTHNKPNLRWQTEHQSQPYALQWHDPQSSYESERPKIHMGAQWLSAIGVGTLSLHSPPGMPPLGWWGRRISEQNSDWKGFVRPGPVSDRFHYPLPEFPANLDMMLSMQMYLCGTERGRIGELYAGIGHLEMREKTKVFVNDGVQKR